MANLITLSRLLLLILVVLDKTGQATGEGFDRHLFILVGCVYLGAATGFLLTVNRLRRGVFTSVPELIGAIDEYIAHHNTKPKPFIWTKSARDILQKVIRANSRLSSKQNATLH